MAERAIQLRGPASSAVTAANIVDMLRVPAITLHAFYQTREMDALLQAVVADRHMSRTHATVEPGGVAAALDRYGGTATPDLVLFESNADAADLFVQLDALAQVCGATTKVIVIGHANDIGLYRGLLARGLSEYILAPVDPVSVIAAISRLYNAKGIAKLGRTFAFVGARGGIGSSTIAHNVAASLARAYGSNVILADLDLPFGSSSLGFNLDRSQGIAQALDDAQRLDEGLFERLLIPCGDHLSVLTAPANLESSYDLAEDAFERVLDIARSTVPFVVLDIPHLWTSWAKKTLLTADEIVVTVAPDLVALRNAKNLLAVLRQIRPNDKPPWLVLNQVGVPKRSEINPAQFAKALEIEPISCIAFDPATFSAAANDGRMISDKGAGAVAVRHFGRIADKISGRTFVSHKRAGRFDIKRLWNL